MYQNVKTPLYAALLVDQHTENKLNSLLKSKKDFDDNFHNTVLYSRKPVVISESILYMRDMKLKEKVYAKVKGYKLFNFKTDNGIYKSFVLELQCPTCIAIHKKLMNLFNASYDYLKYIPHVTLYYRYNTEMDPDEFFERFKNIKIVFDRIRYEKLDPKKYR